MLARILISIVCIAVGYFATGAIHSPATQTAGAKTPGSHGAPPKQPAAAGTALIGEWEQLRAKHDAGGFGPLLSAIDEIEDSYRSEVFSAALLGEWAVRDPQNALAYLMKNEESGRVSQLLVEWLRCNANAALAALLTGDLRSDGTLESLLEHIARLAPNRLAEAVSALPPPDEDSSSEESVREAFRLFAKSAPDDARKAAETLREPFRSEALAGCAVVFAAKDGAAALAWAQSLPPGASQKKAMRAVFSGWAKSDPFAALEKLDLYPRDDGSPYDNPRIEVVTAAAKRDWNAAVRWVASKKGSDDYIGHGLSKAVARHLQRDSEGTLQSLAESGIDNAANIVTGADFDDNTYPIDAVWKWLDSQPSGSFTTSLRTSVLYSLEKADTDRVLHLLERLGGKPEDAHYLTIAASGLATNSSGPELDALIEKAPANLRPYLLAERLQDAAEMETDPEILNAKLRELPDDVRPETASAIASAWSHHDPHAASEWALSLSDAVSRTSAVRTAVSEWADTELAEAAEWADALPLGEVRDAAAETLASSYLETDPQSAWQWATQIKDAESRKSALAQAWYSISRRDPILAQQVLQSSELSPAELKVLRDIEKKVLELQPE